MSVDNERTAAVLRDWAEQAAANPDRYRAAPRWANVRRTGSELWIETAEEEAANDLWSAEFSGLILEAGSLSDLVRGRQRDDLIARIASELPPGLAPARAADEVRFAIEAAQGLLLAQRFKCRVCVNLNVGFSHDVDGTVVEALRFHAISPDRFMVRVPLTEEGLLAARRLGARRVPVSIAGAVSARQAFLSCVIAQPACIETAVQSVKPFMVANRLGEGSSTPAVAALAARHAVRESNRLLNLRVRHVLSGLRSADLVELVAGCDVLSLSAALVREYETRNLNTGFLVSRVESEPEIDAAPDADLEASGLPTLWAVPERLKAGALVLARRDPDRLSAEDIRSALAHAGFPGMLPRLSEDDLGAAQEDGPAPDLALWRGRMDVGKVELDGLLSLYQVSATAKAQRAMCEYILAKL